MRHSAATHRKVSRSPRVARIKCDVNTHIPLDKLRIPYPGGASIAILVVLAYQSVPKPQPWGSLGGHLGDGIALVLATFTVAAAEGAFA